MLSTQPLLLVKMGVSPSKQSETEGPISHDMLRIDMNTRYGKIPCTQHPLQILMALCLHKEVCFHHQGNESLMMEAASTYEMVVNFYQTTWYNSPEESNLHTHHHENMKSHVHILCFLPSFPSKQIEYHPRGR
jgi:hypothetical protein